MPKEKIVFKVGNFCTSHTGSVIFCQNVAIKSMVQEKTFSQTLLRVSAPRTKLASMKQLKTNQNSQGERALSSFSPMCYLFALFAPEKILFVALEEQFRMFSSCMVYFLPKTLKAVSDLVNNKDATNRDGHTFCPLHVNYTWKTFLFCSVQRHPLILLNFVETSL